MCGVWPHSRGSVLQQRKTNPAAGPRITLPPPAFYFASSLVPKMALWACSCLPSPPVSGCLTPVTPVRAEKGDRSSIWFLEKDLWAGWQDKRPTSTEADGQLPMLDGDRLAEDTGKAKVSMPPVLEELRRLSQSPNHSHQGCSSLLLATLITLAGQSGTKAEMGSWEDRQISLELIDQLETRLSFAQELSSPTVCRALPQGCLALGETQTHKGTNATRSQVEGQGEEGRRWEMITLLAPALAHENARLSVTGDRRCWHLQPNQTKEAQKGWSEVTWQSNPETVPGCQSQEWTSRRAADVSKLLPIVGIAHQDPKDL